MLVVSFITIGNESKANPEITYSNVVVSKLADGNNNISFTNNTNDHIWFDFYFYNGDELIEDRIDDIVLKPQESKTIETNTSFTSVSLSILRIVERICISPGCDYSSDILMEGKFSSIDITIEPDSNGRFTLGPWETKEIDNDSSDDKPRVSFVLPDGYKVEVFKVGLDDKHEIYDGLEYNICNHIEFDYSDNSFIVENFSNYIVQLSYNGFNKYYNIYTDEPIDSVEFTYLDEILSEEQVHVGISRNDTDFGTLEYYSTNNSWLLLDNYKYPYEILNDNIMIKRNCIDGRFYMLDNKLTFYKYFNYFIKNSILNGNQVWRSYIYDFDFIVRESISEGTLICLDENSFSNCDLYISEDKGSFVKVENSYSILGDLNEFRFKIVEPKSNEEDESGYNISLENGYKYTLRKINDNSKKEIIYTSECPLVYRIGEPDYVKGIEKQTADVPPTIINNRSYLTTRYIIEPLGGAVSWDGTERKVTCKLVRESDSSSEFSENNPAKDDANVIVELWIGKPTAKINGVETQIDPNNPDVVPTIIDGRTMVPMRFLAESLGCEVEWVAETKEIILTYTVTAGTEGEITVPVEDPVRDDPEYLYVGADSTLRFHHLNCRYVEQILPENRVYFKTREEAIKAGYTPCGVCKP